MKKLNRKSVSPPNQNWFPLLNRGGGGLNYERRVPFSGGCSYFAIIMGNPKFQCWNKTALKKSNSCSKILVFYIFLSIVTSALTYCFWLFTEDLSVLPIILILSLTPSGRWGDLIRPYGNLNISTIFVGSEPNRGLVKFSRHLRGQGTKFANLSLLIPTFLL